MKRTLLLFIDGLGWGTSDPAINPQAAYGGKYLAIPGFRALGGDLFQAPQGGLAKPIDAVLGVEGVPQSATGQTTLLSGVNAQADLGKHLTGFPNERLREILMQDSLLKSFADGRMGARFLNAFRPRFFELPRERQLQFSATTVATLAADLSFFDLDDIGAGRSIYQEFTNRELIEKGFEVEPMTPATAGTVAARESAKNDFTLYEYFQTDRAGHSQDLERCCSELTMLDAFLDHLLAGFPGPDESDRLVVLTSDHGNLEDLSTKRHTRNPIPLIAWGAGAEEFLQDVDRLDQVAGAIRRRHGLAARNSR